MGLIFLIATKFVFIGEAYFQIASFAFLASIFDSLYANADERFTIETLVTFGTIIFILLFAIFFLSGKLIIRRDKMRPFHKIFLHEVMEKVPVTIDDYDTLDMALDLFDQHHVDYLPVVNNTKHIQGVITLELLNKAACPKKQADGSPLYDVRFLCSSVVSNFMTKDIIVLHSYDTLNEAMSIIIKQNKSYIFIVDFNDYIVGVLTRANIAKYLT